MLVLTTVMVWRAPFSWKRLIRNQRAGSDPWHKTGCRALIFEEFLKGITDVFSIPFLLLIYGTCYRVSFLHHEKHEEDINNTDEHTRVLRKKLVEARHALLVIFDAFFAVFALLGALTLIRIQPMVSEWREIKEERDDWSVAAQRRRWALMQPFLGVRDWLAVLGFLVLLCSVYRGVNAVQKLREKCSNQADPSPHVRLTSVIPEFPRKGFKMHIEGVKTPDLEFKKAALYLRDERFWEVVQGLFPSLTGFAKMMLPYQLVPGVLNPEAFRAGETDVSTTLHWDIPAAKDTIRGMLKDLGSAVVPVEVEFDGHKGMLFTLHVRADEVLRCADQECSVNLDHQFSPGATSAGMFAKAVPVPGAPLFTVLWQVVLLEFGMLMADVLAAVLFLLLHLIPWRTYHMYTRMREDAATRDARKAIAAADAVLEWGQKRREVINLTLSRLERRIKNREVPVPADKDESYPLLYRHNYFDTSQVFIVTSQGNGDAREFVDTVTDLLDKSKCLDPGEAGDAVRCIVRNDVRTVTVHWAAAYAHLTHAGVHSQRDVDATELAKDNFPLAHQLAGKLELTVDSLFLPPQHAAEDADFAAPAAPADPESTVDPMYNQAFAARRQLEASTASCMRQVAAAKEKSKAAITCAGQCHGGQGFSHARSVIYKEVVEFGYDVLAVVSTVLVFVSVYRTYTLLHTMCDSKDRRKTAVWNLGQVFVDVTYLVRFVLIIVALRHALHMPLDLVGWVVEQRSFRAARQVISFYFAAVVQDIMQMLSFLFAWRFFKTTLACAVFGVFSPAFLLDHVILASEGSKCAAGFVLIAGTALMWGLPFLVAYGIAPGSASSGLGLFYGVLGVLCLASLGTALRLQDSRVAGVTGVVARYVRLGWFNLMQYLYIVLECAFLVAAVYREAPLATPWREEVQKASQYLLLDFGQDWVTGGVRFGFWAAVAVVGAWYLIGSIPVVTTRILPEVFDGRDDESSSQAWVFVMGLLGKGVFLVVLWNLAAIMNCSNQDECWSGTHQKYGVLALLCTLLYVTTTNARIPLYSDKKCTVMDVRFVELYEAGLGTVTGAAITGAAFMSLGGYGTSEVAWVVLSAGVFGVLWTALYPVSVCSVRTVAVWKALGYASVALSAGAALYADSSGSEPDTVSRVFFVASFALPLAVSIGNSIVVRCVRPEESAEVTPEELQGELIRTAAALQAVGALSPQFRLSTFRRQVRSSIRASPLALQAMKLEDAARSYVLRNVFLGSRSSWYQKMWKLVQPHDDQRDFSRHLMSWEEAWWEMYCDCFCDCGHNKRDRREEPEVHEQKDMQVLQELIQSFANGIAVGAAPRPEGPLQQPPKVIDTVSSVEELSRPAGMISQLSI
eukprot:Hpha_TRINITY_DN16810_c2_g1::TRINITY_DN16810_c2_g1_i2::g.150800::m.150800